VIATTSEACSDVEDVERLEIRVQRQLAARIAVPVITVDRKLSLRDVYLYRRRRCPYGASCRVQEAVNPCSVRQQCC
jgi:hypothetical protein